MAVQGIGEPGKELFDLVLREFARRDLLDQVVRVRVYGRFYSARCDAECFSLYRINERPHVPPGLPGWTVCRLARSECFSLDLSEEAVPEPSSGQALAEARAWVERLLAALDKPGVFSRT
ncbi:hypothetical protein [Desulfoferula mesophila]|uniref:Uncharacterized protein n=1 Tax=Desulfoferula mesophila TaxID=3058419 RepID=A0AAU9EUX1_9BACT|nr:hypothetical protein FAK_24660 [Desulfoferula mesophilus]